jgi:hypothetical protein
MPNIYEIEQYELYVTKYRVEASREAEAIAKLLDGGADAVDNSHEYIEIAEDCGLPADEQQELAAELRSLGVPVDEIIPSIRSVEQVE